MPAPISFDDFISSLADLGRLERADEAMQQRIQAVVAELRKRGTPTASTLTDFIREYPDAVPILATCVGLTQEQLKNVLSHKIGTAGWVKLAKSKPESLIGMLDADFELVARVQEHLVREYTLADVLLERYLWSRRGAASAVSQGRSVEDEVERIVERLGLPRELRTQFAGMGGETAPCDLAIPGGGAQIKIAVAMKGYNSTGSKLTDAVREVERMVKVRETKTYIYVIADGIGWRGRKADLRRIYDFWDRGYIQGLYSLAQLDAFEQELRKAAEREGLL